MSKVAIITDSTAYIPKDLVAKHRIHVAPQILIWDENMYQDGIDIQPTQFYERLQNSKSMPTTAQVTVKTFQELFTNLLKENDSVLAVLISNKLSGTIDSAVQAKALLGDAPVEIVDSETTAMALGFTVLAAARAADQGASLAELKALAEQAKQNVGVIFAVDTLEFLHRGGRIGGASRFLATMMSIKPILEVTGGQVEGIERVRTRKKSLERVVEVISERIGGRSPVRIATLHANSLGDAQDLLAQANQQFKPVESILAEVSPVVGTHAGPGTVGLAFMAGM
jgi:DegV family protein with EDD domain